jgi:hypothetical protein
MSAAGFSQAVYELAEHLIGQELSDQDKRLLRSYFDDAGNVGLAERALYAVQRYTQAQLPSLDSILRKPRMQTQSPTETLIRRIHDEASGLERR